MFVGHSAIAFVLGSMLAYILGYNNEKIIGFGVLAGAFAIVPDLDMGYAFIGILKSGATDISTLQEEFWASGLVVHRGITHSLVIGLFGSLSFGLIAFNKSIKALGFLILIVLMILTLIYNGLLEFAVIVTFSIGGVFISSISRYANANPIMILYCSFIGILSHPFGDIFTGSSPELLYPLDFRILPTRVLLSSDPTLHFLGAFTIELLAIWLAFGVYIKLQNHNIRQYIHYYVATLGIFYSITIISLPPPTLSVSYHFVFTIILAGIIGILAEIPNPKVHSKQSRRRIFLTGLSVITVGLISYSTVYLIFNV
jgi:membrane-bound metal-dependent hydrolase YbcI (DUF457 family)